jgi:target of EGR1 protein 1
VTRLGSGAGWSALGKAISTLPPTGFIALDTEFSGIGGDASLTDSDLNIRYEAVRSLSNTRAILSVGIAVFTPVPKVSNAGKVNPPLASDVCYDVSVFEYCMSCSSPWSICSEAGQFLVAHGFDFNRVFTSGIPYIRASTEKVKGASLSSSSPPGKSIPTGTQATNTGGSPFSWGPMPRGLLWRLGRLGVPMVLHNGWFDLAIMYAAFQGPLPPRLSDFAGLLLDAVPGGFYDTKHVASVVTPIRATFLGYLYAKLLQESAVSVRPGPGLPSVEIAAPEDHGEFGSSQSRAISEKQSSLSGVCMLYCLRGYCHKGVRCTMSHDPFRVLEFESSNVLPDVKEARKMNTMQHHETKKRRHEAAESNGMSQGSKPSKKKKPKKKEKEDEATNNDTLHGQGCAAMGAACNTGPLTASASLKGINFHVNGDSGQAATVSSKAINPTEKSGEAAHSSGWDAYMTGYCFAAIRAQVPPEKLAQERNKLSLARKKQALLLCKSRFVELNAETESTPANVPPVQSPKVDNCQPGIVNLSQSIYMPPRSQSDGD